MDILFSELKKKDVIDVCTGKKLGKISDVTFSFPEGKVKTFQVSSGMFSCGEAKTLRFSDIERIGQDAVLIDGKAGKGDAAQQCQPKCPPQRPQCPPPCDRKGDRPQHKGMLRLDDDDYE